MSQLTARKGRWFALLGLGMAALGILLATPACGGDTEKPAEAKVVSGSLSAPASTSTGAVSGATAASTTEQAEPFFVETMVTTVSRQGTEDTVICVPATVFKRGERIVWRFHVVDRESGNRVTELDGAEVKVVLPHGEELPSLFPARGGTGPWMWLSAWDVPPDYPLGFLDYNIVVTSSDGSRTATIKGPALLRAATATATGIDSRLQVVP